MDNIGKALWGDKIGKSFSSFGWRNGFIADLSDEFPTRLYAWRESGGHALRLSAPGSTFYGFVFTGGPMIASKGCSVHGQIGTYFSAPDDVWILGGTGILMERVGHRGVFSFGGPVEDRGRLRYIDGCTDSLLIGPQRVGDPCLNALFFPRGIDQTMHTHPSDRIGMIYSGSGVCETPDGAVDLVPGMIFRIHAGGHHRFRTPHTDMRVIAYHPDSDVGPNDESHPMLTRTMVNGVSAANIASIRSGADTEVAG